MWGRVVGGGEPNTVPSSALSNRTGDVLGRRRRSVVIERGASAERGRLRQAPSRWRRRSQSSSSSGRTITVFVGFNHLLHVERRIAQSLPCQM